MVCHGGPKIKTRSPLGWSFEKAFLTMTTTSSNFSSFSVSKPTVSSRPALIGYWHNWHTEAASFLRLRDVSMAFDVINVAFAVADAQRTGRLVFIPCEQTSLHEFKADVAALHDSGRKVLISVGGANGSIALENLSARQNFVDSLDAFLNEYGFDGVDINLEGTVHLEAGDDDLQNPTSPSVLHLVEALRELKNRFGDGFMLSLAPQVACVQGGFSTYRGALGSYLPVIEQLRNILDYVHVQHYNASPQKGLDGKLYDPDSPDFHVAMAEMLLLGFPVAGHQSRFFAGLRPEQVSLGLPSGKAIVQNGYAEPGLLGGLLARLAHGADTVSGYRLQSPQGYSGFGALMTWSINWDAAAGFVFSAAARQGLDVLPG
jgi:chitinase